MGRDDQDSIERQAKIAIWLGVIATVASVISILAALMQMGGK
jgi:hypothetical protein